MQKNCSSTVFFNWLWLTPERAGRCTLEVTQLLKTLQLLLCTTPRSVSGKGGVVLETLELGEGGSTVSFFPLLLLKKQTILPLAFTAFLIFKNPFHYC
jgi:hypothetical protein